MPSARVDRVVASCIFVDVGATFHAYVYMEALTSGQIRVVHTWYVKHRRGWLWDKLILLDAHRGSFFVETIRGQIYKGRSATGVLETKEMEGRIKEAAEVRSVVAVEVEANDWRTELLGSAIMSMRPKPPLDPVIKFVVERIFTEPNGSISIPNTVSESSSPDVHIFDAIGGGMVALARITGRKIALPKAIMEEAYKVALQARAGRAALKMAKSLGVKVPRRKLSQAARKKASEKSAATKKRNAAAK